MKKHFHRGKKRRFFPYFHYEIIFCCAELFECILNFKFCWNIFIFLNINTNQTSKEQDLNFIRSSHLFWEQPWRDLLEAYVRSKLSGLQLYFTGVFENFRCEWLLLIIHLI